VHRPSASSNAFKNDIPRVIEAIKSGFAGPDLKAEWDALQERKTAPSGEARISGPAEAGHYDGASG